MNKLALASGWRNFFNKKQKKEKEIPKVNEDLMLGEEEEVGTQNTQRSGRGAITERANQ